MRFSTIAIPCFAVRYYCQCENVLDCSGRPRPVSLSLLRRGMFDCKPPRLRLCIIVVLASVFLQQNIKSRISLIKFYETLNSSRPMFCLCCNQHPSFFLCSFLLNYLQAKVLHSTDTSFLFPLLNIHPEF